MDPFGGYVTVKVGAIAPAKLRKALEGSMVRLSNTDLSGDRVMVVSRVNGKAIKAAQAKGKGLSTSFTSGEMTRDLKYHDKMGGSLAGGSLWSWIKDKAIPWVRKNWNIIQPVISHVADAAVPAAASALGAPQAADAARATLKSLTGVGVAKQSVRGNFARGSPEAKEYMASLRAKRKVGGSFRIN
jgi:hypothetical protein